MKFRYDLLNFLISNFGLKSYLEIGYQNGICYDNIKISEKNAVDPYPNMKKDNTLKVMTSDNFFKTNTKKYDIIFIDGLHTYDQVKEDFKNSIKALNNGGFIVLHDMNPSSEERAKSFSDGGVWNGDCFKLAIDFYNGYNDFEYITLNMDQGCMVVMTSNKKESINVESIENNYKSFDENRNEILNLITPDDFVKKYKIDE